MSTHGWHSAVASRLRSGPATSPRSYAELFRRHGKPEIIRSDNGREFVAASLMRFLDEHQVRPVFIERGSPQQNAFVERFNGTMRDEKLNGEEFDSALEARVVLEAWIQEYNQLRPHRGLGMKTPQQFADEWKKGRA
jgi:transposase InsO family protein